MALKLNINLKALPTYVKVILSMAPAVLIVIGVVFLLILPKHKEIKRGTFREILREMDITEDEFRRILKKH